MSKKLNIENITNELEGASLFFNKPTPPPPSNQPGKEPVEPVVIPKPETKSKPVKTRQEPQPLSEKAVNSLEDAQSINASINARMHARINESMHAPKHALIQESIIETIRKAVKDVGQDS